MADNDTTPAAAAGDGETLADATADAVVELPLEPAILMVAVAAAVTRWLQDVASRGEVDDDDLLAALIAMLVEAGCMDAATVDDDGGVEHVVRPELPAAFVACSNALRHLTGAPEMVLAALPVSAADASGQAPAH